MFEHYILQFQNEIQPEMCVPQDTPPLKLRALFSDMTLKCVKKPKQTII